MPQPNPIISQPYRTPIRSAVGSKDEWAKEINKLGNRTTAIESRLSAIEASIQRLENIQPIKGEKGDKGDKGDTGDSPDPEDIARRAAAYITIDVDAISSAVQRNLDPIHIGQKDDLGNIIVEPTPAHLGDTIFLRITPPRLSNAN